MFVRAAFLSSLSLLAFTGTAQAQSSGDGSAAAYRYALRCFVATGRQDEAGARVSYNAALRLGRAQGFTNARINADFADTMSTENLRIARSEAYRQQLLSECRRLGMAS